jgi:hypothetical protein
MRSLAAGSTDFSPSRFLLFASVATDLRARLDRPNVDAFTQGYLIDGLGRAAAVKGTSNRIVALHARRHEDKSLLSFQSFRMT